MIGPGCEYHVKCDLRANWDLEYVERPAPDAHGEGYSLALCEMHTLAVITRLMVDPSVYSVEVERK